MFRHALLFVILLISSAIIGLSLGTGTAKAFNAPGPKWQQGPEFTQVCYFLTSSAKSAGFISPLGNAGTSWRFASAHKFRFLQTSKSNCPKITTPSGIEEGGSYWDGKGTIDLTAGDILMVTECTFVQPHGTTGFNKIVRCKVKTNNVGLHWIQGSTSKSCRVSKGTSKFQVDIETTALHEKGHWLKLDHVAQGPVMNGVPFFVFSPCDSNGKMVIVRNLTGDDVNGIKSLYP